MFTSHNFICTFKKLSFMTSSHTFSAYMKLNAVPKAASAGDQLASRNPAPVAPPVQQTPVVKQVIHCIQIGQLVIASDLFQFSKDGSPL